MHYVNLHSDTNNQMENAMSRRKSIVDEVNELYQLCRNDIGSEWDNLISDKSAGGFLKDTPDYCKSDDPWEDFDRKLNYITKHLERDQKF